MFRVLPRRFLFAPTFLITAVMGLAQISPAQDPNNWPVSVKPHGKDTTKNPPDPTPSVFVQVGTTQHLEFEMLPIPGGNQHEEGQDSMVVSWIVPPFVRFIAPDPDTSGIKIKPDKTYTHNYFGVPYLTQYPPNHPGGVGFVDTADFKISALSGTGRKAPIDFTPKKAGYWSIEVDFTAIVPDTSTSPATYATYKGKGIAFIVAAQATIVTDPPSVTNVIVGQQLNPSAKILPNDIDTTSKTSTAYVWNVPNDPLTKWKALVNSTDRDRDPMGLQKYTDSTPVKFSVDDSKQPAPHFFWYHNGSTSGVAQTVSAKITDPAWTGGDGMPISLTPSQNFTLYQPSNTFVATPVAKPSVEKYLVKGIYHYKIGLGRLDGVFPTPPSYTPPAGASQFGIVFTIPDADSLVAALGTPAGAFQWCQIVERLSGTASNATSTVSLPTPKGYALDGLKDAIPWPYPAVAGTQAADSPSTPDIDAYNTVTADEAFTMYLMYTPPQLGNNPSFAVPLKKLSWSWKANFAFDLMNGWVDQGSSNNPNSQTNMVTDADYPTWTDWMGNYDPLLWN